MPTSERMFTFWGAKPHPWVTPTPTATAWTSLSSRTARTTYGSPR